MIRRVRVNAALYQLALIIGAANCEAADFAHASVVAFETDPPYRRPVRTHRGLVLTQTPGRLDVPPEPESAGPADDAWAAPVLRVVGQLPDEENQPCL